MAVWGCFFIANSRIGVITGLAIVQTNFEEDVSYIFSMLPVYTCIGVVFGRCADIVAICQWLGYRQQHFTTFMLHNSYSIS